MAGDEWALGVHSGATGREVLEEREGYGRIRVRERRGKRIDRVRKERWRMVVS